MNIFQFFTDPILRAPTIGSMLMCFSASLVGVLVFIRKRSLLGETLSHATYPGVNFSIVCTGLFALERELPILILIGAFFSALVGFGVIEFLEKKLKVSSDAALCAVLALFFGVGITIASIAQASFAHLHRQTQAYLYGQAATMTDLHILLYGVLALVVVLVIFLFYKEILTFSFDRQFAKTHGIINRYLNSALLLLIVLALVIGIRCVGVILMSAMLIAPAAAARQFTNRLSNMFILSGCFGAVSGLLGIYLSVVLSQLLTKHYALPTGPMIVLVSGTIALYSLLFAPKRGLVIRYLRVVQFRTGCIQENLLKTLWRLSKEGKKEIPFHEIAERQGFSEIYLKAHLLRLIWKGLLQKKRHAYSLTPAGNRKGARIIRLHRLWEAYLVHSLGLKIERVHKSAEEMEHILTPELEQQLTELLDNPKQDPHDQPIPSIEETYVY